MCKHELSMGERFIPSLAGWSQAQKEMFFGNYQWAKQFIGNKIVLDCACGSGYGTDILSKYCKFVVGADVDPEIIQYAQTHYQAENISFVVSSATAIPYQDSFFDLVVSYDTIEHVEDDESMISELKRVTTDGGEIILSTPVGYYHKNQGEESLFDSTHIREYSAYEWLDMLSNHFSIAEIYTRDQNFKFTRVFPGSFNGSPFDVSFVKVVNSKSEPEKSRIDEAKELVALQMTHHIKTLEGELNQARSDFEAFRNQSIEPHLLRKILDLFTR